MVRYNLFTQSDISETRYELELYNATLEDVQDFLESNTELLISPQKLMLTSSEISFDFDFNISVRDKQMNKSVRLTALNE